ncbi:MAG TPA: protein-disulfide reductase DsbD domain-containing protein, partial [Tepidisphaeraceae bacterium]|nr:protein-disulfide reductase DsbD domain-containing protein [Tepidisphaeraceae bacterium]
MQRILPIALLALILNTVGLAADHATVSTALNYQSLQGGQQAVIAIVTDIEPGFHAQSHTPLDENYIPFNVELVPNPQIDFHPPIFPPGKIEDFPALGKLSVYTGKVVVYVPIEMKRDAQVGAITISGTVSYQICDDKACYAPQKTPITLTTQVVPAEETVQPNQPELFAGFNPAATTSLSLQALLAQFLLAFVVG